LLEHSQFGSTQLLFIPIYKNFTEMHEFWIRVGPAAYITHAKSGIRRCVPEMFPNVTEKNSFMYSCQRNLLWRGQQQLIALSWVWTYLQSQSWNLPAIPYTLSGRFLFNNIQTIWLLLHSHR
jgi:hypothetical protein